MHPTPILPRPLYAPNTPLTALRTAELLLVAALRLWAAPYRTGGEVEGDWRDGFVAGGVDARGIDAFEAIVRLVAAGPRRRLDVRCRRCAALGGDEASLLRLVGALQRDRVAAAAGILGQWLPPAAARAALPAARSLAVSFALAGLRVPPRHGEAALPVASSPASADRGMALLH
jgi:hypothetical protein